VRKLSVYCDREIGFTAITGTSRCRMDGVAFIDFSNRRQPSDSDFAFDAFPKRDGRNQPGGPRETVSLRTCRSLLRAPIGARQVGLCVRSWRRPSSRGMFVDAGDGSARPGYEVAAGFSFDNARIFTRTLAGFAPAFTISPVEGLRTRVPAVRAGTLRRLTFSSPGNTNSPTPRGWTEPRNRLLISTEFSCASRTLMHETG
jgi:hypothetical protein